MFCSRIRIISTLLASCCASAVTACVGAVRANNTDSNLPANFPCQWTDGIIPYAFDFYAINSNRLRRTIRKGHELIQNRSCLVFNERSPITLAGSSRDYYYLYYTYSNALEDCCAAPIEPGFGRRVVLLTPGCKEPHEIAHVTLHMLGLSHGSGSPFPVPSIAAILSLDNCQKRSSVAKFSSVLSRVGRKRRK